MEKFLLFHTVYIDRYNWIQGTGGFIAASQQYRRLYGLITEAKTLLCWSLCCLFPPWVLAGPEVGLDPRDEDDLAIINVSMNQGQRQGSRSTDNLALVVVLGSMARAKELVLGGVKRHDAAKVGADRVDPVGGEGLVGLHDEVRRITLESLCERAVVGAVRLEPFLDEDVVAELVLGDGPAGVAPGAGGDEEGAVGDEHAEGGERDGAQQEEVHQLPLTHVRDAVGGDAAGHARDVPRDALPGEAQAPDRLAQRRKGPAELRPLGKQRIKGSVSVQFSSVCAKMAVLTVML